MGHSQYVKEIKYGKDSEKRFIEFMQSNGCEVTKSSTHDDIYSHFDYYVKKGNHTYKFEVKGKKKNRRSDQKQSDDITWIELKGITGHNGWVFGQSDYIAFEHNNGFLLVKREKVVEIVFKKLIQNGFKEGRDMYQLYNRNGRDDLIVKIKMSDLK